MVQLEKHVNLYMVLYLNAILALQSKMFTPVVASEGIKWTNILTLSLRCVVLRIDRSSHFLLMVHTGIVYNSLLGCYLAEGSSCTCGMMKCKTIDL